MYYWSDYNVFVDVPEEQSVLLYNSITNMLWCLEKESFEDLKQLVFVVKNGLYYGNHPIHDKLFQNGVISQYTHEEEVEILKAKYFLKKSDSSIVGLTILTTMDCNFKCSYCYEDETPKKYMRDEVFNAILEYLKKKKDARLISLTWLGGEPLLNFRAIREISLSLNQLGLPYESTLVTNGYLLTKEKVDKFESFRITNTQVTIDGIGEEHNEKRPHRYKNNSYEVIVKNLRYVHDETNLNCSLRVNIDKNNVVRFVDIYKQLKYLFPRFHVYPGIITDSNLESGKNKCTLNRHELSAAVINAYKEHGVAMLPLYPDMKGGVCGAECNNSYVVGPSGELYKCWNDAGLDDRVVGSILPNLQYKKNTLLLAKYFVGSNPFEIENCLKCLLLPQCFGGGCPYKLVVKDSGKAKGRNEYCPHFKDSIEDFVKLHYHRKVKKGGLV
jgi:uncharacterized protein